MKISERLKEVLYESRFAFVENRMAFFDEAIGEVALLEEENEVLRKKSESADRLMEAISKTLLTEQVT